MPLLYYVVGSPSEDDSTRSGPAFGGVGSVVFLKGLGGVAPRMASTGTRLPFVGELLWWVFLAWMSRFLQRLSNMARSSGIGVFRAFSPCASGTRKTALPIANNFSFCPRCRSMKALQRCWSSSRIARLWTHVSPRARSCCRRTRSEASSGIRSFTCMRKLGIWNSTGITASNPYAKRNGVACTLVLKLVM